MNSYYPLKLKAVSKETVWGGDRLCALFRKGESSHLGESWELSVRENEKNIILNGAYAGMTLNNYIESRLPEISAYSPFPILIKFIDAKDDLSVQVHPDDATAKRLGDDIVGKTEMWHILEAQDGASIVYGLKEGIGKNELRLAVKEDRIEDILNYVPVKRGDTFFIPAGLVHAIGKGIVLAEIQQNSDTTYRFYDYGRPGLDGKPRELHTEKAIEAFKPFASEAINTERFEACLDSIPKDALACCRYFSAFLKIITKKESFSLDGYDFISIICLSGCGSISYDEGSEALSPGDSFFIPARLKNISLNGDMTVIISSAPTKSK